MAKSRSREDESLLLRSAESLGRMIGSLQRQLEAATGGLAGSKPNGAGRKKNSAGGGARKTSAAQKSAKKR
jgi:predicted component of type VI protein secretion system